MYKHQVFGWQRLILSVGPRRQGRQARDASSVMPRKPPKSSISRGPQAPWWVVA